MLRWMKKGNDVLLLQGNGREEEEEWRGGEGGEDWRRKRFVRFGASPSVFLIQVQIAPWGKCRTAQYSAERARQPTYIHTTCYTPLRSYILSDAHNESNSCAVHSSLSK